MTEWEQILAEKPHHAPFQIEMNASSVNEEWADIDTKLDQNHGWNVVGIAYTFEGLDPTDPITFGAAINRVEVIQVQRTLDSDILLPAFDPNCLLHHAEMTVFLTSGLHVYQHPIRVPCNEVTRCQNLRVMFRTRNDNTEISAATIQLTGVLLYHLISAPDDGRTKLGIPIDEI